MRRTPLTELSVRAAKPPLTGTLTLWDSTVRGLGLRCSQGGTKTFIVMMGKERSRTRIGHYPQWTVKEARTEALRIIAERSRRPMPKRVPLEQVFEQFSRAHLSQYRPRNRKEVERIITKHLLTPLGKRAIGDITTDDLTRITDALIHKPGVCAHVHTKARLLFRWAVKRRLLDRSPLEGLGSPVKLRDRDRVLTDPELRHVYGNAISHGCMGGKIVQLLILTGQRRSEIAGLRGEYINRDNRTITLPGEITKNRRTHTFPYGDMVAALLEGMPEEGYLFPARGSASGRPYSGWSKLKVSVHGGIPAWTLHDLRRTFATNLASLEVPPHVIERILNHISGTISGVAAIYNRYKYQDEMEKALQRYEDWLQALLSTKECTNGRDNADVHRIRA